MIMLLGCAAFQRRMLYYPTIESSPTMQRLAEARGFERWRNSASHNIGWKRLARGSASSGEVLITHGNGGCAVDRVEYAQAINEFLRMDVYILEYPGYGDRAGEPSQKAFFDAAEEGCRSLPTRKPIYLLGESLGTGVAAYLAGMHPEISGVLLFAPYNSLVDVGQYHIRILPASWLMVDRYPSEQYLARYRGPVAIVVGGKDRVVPEQFGRKLYDGYRGPKRLWAVPEGSHESIQIQDAEFYKELEAFWRANGVTR